MVWGPELIEQNSKYLSPNNMQARMKIDKRIQGVKIKLIANFQQECSDPHFASGKV